VRVYFGNITKERKLELCKERTLVIKLSELTVSSFDADLVRQGRLKKFCPGRGSGESISRIYGKAV
jgi:hypothetical protein